MNQEDTPKRQVTNEDGTITIYGGMFGEKEWDDQYRYMFFAGVYEGFAGYHFVMPYAITFELPLVYDPYDSHLKVLKAQKNRILAENQQKVNNIDEIIQRHLALEHRE